MLFVLTYNLGNFMRRLVLPEVEALDSDQSSDQAESRRVGDWYATQGGWCFSLAGNQGKC